MKRSLLNHALSTVAVTAILSPWILASSASSAMMPATDNVRINADKQSYNLGEKKYYLNGHVNVAFQNMRITGTTAQVSMDEAGKPQVAQFFNRPMFKRVVPKTGEDKVVGDMIKVYLNEDRYGAEGNVDSHIATVAADPFHIRSDIQEFDNKNRVVSASGNVHVDYKGSQASSSLANVRMKEGGKADRAIFTGNARILQENSEILGERITVMVDSGNLIAEHNVKTRVDLKPPPPAPNAVKPGVAAGAAAPVTPDQPTKVLITSDYQQYDKAADKMIASGNVKILYGDYVAVGPKATFKLKGNDLDRITMSGRPTITDNGRTVTGDIITITTNPKNFDAVGNVKVNFKASNQTPEAGASPATGSGKSVPGKVVKGANGKPLPADDPGDY
jgi:lipopolysaccharide export system protein LptA